MGWLRLLGSFKLQVSFVEYSLFYKALLQKRPVILRSLLIVAIPYDICTRRAMLRGSEHTYAFILALKFTFIYTYNMCICIYM